MDEEVLVDLEEGGWWVVDGSSLVLVEVGVGFGVVLVVLGGSGWVSGELLPSTKCHSPYMTPADSGAKNLKRPRDKSRPP